MHIRQLQVAFESLQDRLLLRVSTAANEEIRVHITRRFLRELWPALVSMLFGHLAAPQAAAPGGDAGGADKPAGNFDQPYKNDNPIYPLGANPLLAAEAALDPAGPGLCRLTLREVKERSVSLALDGDLLQAFCSMLRATAGQAKWDLDLEYAGARPAAPAVPTVPPPAKTHLH